MSKASEADRKTILRDKMNELEKEIDELIITELEVSQRINNLERRINAETAMLRQSIREQTMELRSEVSELRRIRKARRKRIFDFWNTHHPDKKMLVFPSAMAIKANNRELVIKDRVALLDALDRIGRLDLVDYVFKENIIAKLIEKGKLPGLDKKVVRVKDNIELRLMESRGSDHGV